MTRRHASAASDGASDPNVAGQATSEPGKPGASGQPARSADVPGDAGAAAGAAGAASDASARDASLGDIATNPAVDPAAEAIAAQHDKYLRLLADYENFKKRVTKERLEAEQRGMGVLISGIMDALDDLSRFAHLDPAGTSTKLVVDGAEMVERKILKSLAGHGLEVVNPLGAPFDPAHQEALTTVPAESELEDHIVAQVYQVGYVFNGMLLRPARVVVKQWRGAPEGSR